MKRTMMLWAMGLSLMGAHAQPWDIGGNAGLDNVDNYIGTNDNVPLNFRTDSLFRMRLYPTTTINDSLGVFRLRNSGFLGLSARPEFFTDTPGPFSRLHLVDSIGNNVPNIYAQSGSFRPWQRNGVTFTGNADHGYIGQKFNTLDLTDMVIHWANDVGAAQFAPDYLRFIFTGGYDSTRQTGARSLEGAEGMRLYPVNDTSIFVGVGDFFKASVDGGFNIRPSERLDVLDGRVRIRQLPTELEADTVEKFVVVNEDGVLGWRPVASLPDNCEWRFQNPASNLNVVTAFGAGSPGCPGRDNNVGIGTNTPTAAKLMVRREPVGTSNVQGLNVRTLGGGGVYTGANILSSPTTGHVGDESNGLVVEAENASERIHGVISRATLNGGSTGSTSFGVVGTSRTQEGSSLTNGYGIHGTGSTSGSGTTVTNLYGGFGLATIASSTNATNAYGLKGEARRADGASFTNLYGVYGQVPGDADTSSMATIWAGFFQGKLKVTQNAYVNGNVYVTSDGQFKTNVQDIIEASELIAALRPKSYEFIGVDHPGLVLPSGTQFGLVAQELEQVLPQLVQRTTHPAAYDTLGAMTHAAQEMRMVNYLGLIPLLIAGMQEQQVQLDEQLVANETLQGTLEDLHQRLSQLETALANCCAAHGNDADQRSGSIDNSQLSDPASERLLTIAPNPFTDRTTVSYTLERGGRAQLLVNSSDGKHLQVLEEGVRSEGQYNYTWSTAQLAPGVYYVTLLLDGEPLVKRAVKVR
ncbi:MAG: tail fiber domain-containing protein [Flavobacteriales bacterium]|nr:tail fiber domain-containing protein [Flavobacteriales bacterium]